AAARAGLRIGGALGLRLALWGDAGGAALRARVRDARGRDYTLELCPKVTWKDAWRELRGPVPASPPPPPPPEVDLPASHPPSHGAVLSADVRADSAPEPPDLRTASGVGAEPRAQH